MPLIALGDIVRHHARRKPDNAIAVSYPDGEWTWWELEARANQRARFFRDLGVGHDDVVTIAVPNSSKFFEITFALWKLGATPNVISSRLPLHEKRAIAELARPKLVVAANPEPLGDVPSVPFDADASGYSGDQVDATVGSHWKAMTSGGSTGRPKLIVDHMKSEYDPANTQYYMRQDDVILVPGPLYHNSPFCCSHLPLFNGSKIVGLAKFDALEALKQIEKHRVGWVNFVPTMMHRIWALPAEVRNSFDLSSLQTVWHMAAPMPVWLKHVWIEWLGADRIFELYGGTEAQGQTWIDGNQWLKKPGSVGLIHGDAKIRVVREDGADCAPGEVGEVYLLPADLANLPYHYVGAEPKRLAGGWESLGDMGYLDQDSYLFLADRRTDLILRGGANIYPAEIEAAIDSHPAIASSIVIGLPDADLGQRVLALVQPKDETVAVAALHAFLKERLAGYKLPGSYEFSDTPLRDDAGKARCSALRNERIDWLNEKRDFMLTPRHAG